MSRIRQKKFKAFIHQIEGKTIEVESYHWTEEELDQLGMNIVWLETCKEFLVTRDSYLLEYCFNFRRTPQGSLYWWKKVKRKEEVSEKDIAFVQAVVDYWKDKT